MTGSPLFAIVLALFVVFLTMSMLVSALQEMAAQILKVRSSTLQLCIKHMLHDNVYGDKIYNRFFRHPRVATPGYSTSYLTKISPDDFAVSLATAIQPHASPDDALTAFPDSILALHEGELKQRMRLAMPEVFSAGDPKPSTETIKKSITGWFDASMNKANHHYESATKMRLYIIAAFATVALNVSPIEIVQRLQSDSNLRGAITAATPALESLLSQASATAGTAAAPDGSTNNAGGGAISFASSLSPDQKATALTVFNCARDHITLPIGWPWMAQVVEVAKKKTNALTNSTSPQAVSQCDQQLLDSKINGDDKMKAYLASLNLDTSAGSNPFKTKYGPTFESDPWYLILLGWLIMTFGAAQGAPFWFDLLKKILQRAPLPV